jgi:membrane protease YdiL (CAAX protease family)
MLAPDGACTPTILWVILAALLVMLVVRTILKDRREYQRFKRLRSTAKRQAMFRKWLLDSMLSIGLVAVVLLVLVWQYVPRFRAELRSWFEIPPGWAWAILVGGVLGFTVLTALGIRSARHAPDDLPTIGDVAAMLPRNRQEIRLGWALSINAGISEELMFRLALPTVVYGASGSAIAAVVVSVLVFGALHAYQGVTGVVGTTLIGAFLFFTLLATGSILAPILLHILFDLRSLVLIPTAVFGAHKVDGRVQKYISRPKPKPVADAAAPGSADAAAPATPDGPRPSTPPVE